MKSVVGTYLFRLSVVRRFQCASWFLGLGLLFATGCGTPMRLTTVSRIPWEIPMPVDLQGRTVDPFSAKNGKGTVLLFLRTDCPISNHYAPEIRRLHEKYAPQGFSFWLVYPDADVAPAEIARHQQEYSLPPGALIDARHVLVEKAEAKITPEAALFLADGKRVYLGRIDNRYVDFGRERSAATRHDLEDALDAVLGGRAVVQANTAAIGCYISEPMNSEKK